MSDDMATKAAKDLAEGEVNPLTGGRGAQIALTGAAQAAARGETHGSIEENVAAREAAMAAGETADGASNVAVPAPETPADPTDTETKRSRKDSADK